MTAPSGDPQPLRILLIAEAANPEWTSVPLVGWSIAHALTAQPELSTHLVTQVRNRPAILKTGLVEGTDFTAIDTEALTAPAYRLITRLRGGANKGWTTATAFSAVSYYHFENLLWKQFGPDIKAGAFDIVHRVTPLSPTVPSRLAKWCKDAGTPFVLGPLNGGLPWPPGFDSVRRQEKEWLSYVRNAYKFMPGYKGTRANAAAIIVASQETHRQIPPQYHDKCVYIPENGIDPTRFPHHRTRHAQRPLRCAFVGRLVPYKGADMVLEAAKTLLSEGALTLDIVGDGPELPTLQNFTRQHALEHATRFHGWIPHEQVGDMLVNADLFVFPSIREFGGGAVLEAMAVGLTPVIADYGGPAELVTDSTGIKIPMGRRDQIVDNLRQALTRLVDQPASIDTMGQAAYQRARSHFTWQAKARQILDVYKWTLGQTPKPSFF